MYSPPGRLLEKKELGLVSVSPSVCRVGLHTCHSVNPLLSLSPWSPHLPQCQSTSVSVALVSTLATVSVHFCLCHLGLHTCHSVSPLLSLSPWSSHLPQCQSTSVCRLGLHTCHSVCLPPWSSHLLQCQPTSVSVALVFTLATVSVHNVLECLSYCPCGYTDGTTE